MLRDLDPLRDEAPVLHQDLRFIPDNRPPREKIVAALRSKLGLAGKQELRVVVTLREPSIDLTLEPKSQGLNEIRARYLGALELEFVRQAKSAGFKAVRGYSLFPIVIGVVSAGNLEQLAALPVVRWVQEEQTYTATRTQGGALMRADLLRSQLGANGLGVGVAVLDTGIDWNHTELASRVAAQGDFTGTTGNGLDDVGHGTAVAGIIAGTQGGMAPQATVWAMKVLFNNGASGSGTDAMILAGLQSVLANQNNFGGVHIVNMSLGGGGPHNTFCDAQIPSYTSVFQSLFQAGILVLVASGNDALKNGIASPACHSWNFSVGAVYDANVGSRFFSNCSDFTTTSDKVTCYSNSGSTLDLLGPADCSVTPRLGGGLETCFNGTSAATPYAAGVAAQLLSLQPTATPGSLFNALSTTGVPVTDSANGLTRPRVDALAASSALANIFTDGFESGNTNAWN